jgi:Fic family protein
VRPPFRITPEILRLTGEIARWLGRCEGLGEARPQPRLRRENRIRTVQGTVAIEGNSLSFDQITAILEGKRVRGPAREVQEVRNVIAAYDRAPRWHPGSARDLLAAHAVVMEGLVPDAGRWRSRDVGVIRGSKVGHVAPRAVRVPALMRDLISFLTRDRVTPPLVKSCVFHYELEFIHPFSDGNGRLGRLWQHVILLGESPTFAFVPTESIIRARQREYYAVLTACDQAGESTAFVEFALDALRKALAEFVSALRPVRPDSRERLFQAGRRFGPERFSRKDYLALHPAIATATASRDLQLGVARGLLRREGDRATARYRFRTAVNGSEPGGRPGSRAGGAPDRKGWGRRA